MNTEESLVYEDEKTIVFIPDRPKVEGHLVVIPRDPYRSINDVPPQIVSHLFYVASFAATTLFEGLGAEGTNIIMNDGEVSRMDRLTIDIIPRKQDDGIGFKWEPKKLTEEEMKDSVQKITWELNPGQDKHIKQVSREEIEKKSKDESDKEQEMMIKFYEKTP